MSGQTLPLFSNNLPIRVKVGGLCRVDRRTTKGGEHSNLRYIGLEHVISQTGDIIGGSRDEPVDGACFLHDERHVLYGKLRPYLNKVALPDQPGRCSMELIPLLPMPGISREYLASVLRHPELIAYVMGRTTGARMPRADIDQLLAYEIVVPSFQDRERIVDILNHAASVRRLRDEARTKLREIIPALFAEMFGDPVTNPKGWPMSPLAQVIAGLEGGKNLQAGDEGVSDFRILKISAVTSGVFRSEESKPAPASYTPPPNHFVRQGDILFSRANTVDLVGAVACVHEVPQNLLLPDKLWRFLWHQPSQIIHFYLLHFLKQSHTRAALSLMATGTSDSMRNISQAKLMTLPIMVPPLPLQQEFADRVAEIESAAALSDKAVAVAEQLTQSLLAQVFGATACAEAPELCAP